MRFVGPAVVGLLVLAVVLVTASTLGIGTSAPQVATAASTPSPAPTEAFAAQPQAQPSPAPAAVNVYQSTISGQVSSRLAGVPERVYVPNSDSNTVFVIDPATYKVVDRYVTGPIPHHVAPAPDLSRLYVDNEGGSTLTVIDIHTGRPSGTIPVAFPYNLYFTPDGQKAVDVVERLQRIDFYDPKTWKYVKSVPIPWAGADHLDFTADGRYLFISTEYTGMLARVDTETMELSGTVVVGGLPVDVRLSPDGRFLYVANQGRNGVSVVDPELMKEVAFIPTGQGAHGLQVSRDTTRLYVSNRLAGTISTIDFAAQKVVATWKVGGSPDMLQLNPAGTELWYTNRYNASVTVVDTGSGQVTHTIPVGPGAHGLTYFPNAGETSIGHNGVYR